METGVSHISRIYFSAAAGTAGAPSPEMTAGTVLLLARGSTNVQRNQLPMEGSPGHSAGRQSPFYGAPAAAEARNIADFPKAID
jgi:hypothetical protein